METEEKIDTEPVVVSKSKRIWSVILDIVLFTVGFILLMNLAVLISFIFSETSSEGESPSLFLLIQNQVLMLVSVCVSAWLVLKYRNLPFSRLGLSWQAVERVTVWSLVGDFTLCGRLWLVFTVGGSRSDKRYLFSCLSAVKSSVLLFGGSFRRAIGAWVYLGTHA